MTIEAVTEPAASVAPNKTTWTKSIAFSLAVGVAIYAYENWDTVSTQYLGLSYTCENMVTELTQLSPSSALSPRLIGVLDRRTLSTTPERVECSGVGMFSNGMRAPISYRVWQEGDQWFIFYEAVD